MSDWKLVPCELTPEMRAAWDTAPYSEDLDEEMRSAYRAMIAAAPVAAPDSWKHCPHCGTHEIELDRTCHNSSCSAYAQAESVYRGWEVPKPK